MADSQPAPSLTTDTPAARQAEPGNNSMSFTDTMNNPQDNSTPNNDDWLANDPLGFDEFIGEEQMPYPASSTESPIMATESQTMPTDVDSQNPQSAPIQQNDEPEIEFDGDTSRANPHFKPLLPEPINRDQPARQLIMDTETTGLDALKGDRIIEVGIIELVNRKFTGEKLHVYINPERGMDDEVIRVHGISEAFLADKPKFKEVAQPLYEFMIGAEVIAHNAPFDISFLSMEFNKVGLTDFADKITVTDSLVMAKHQYPGQKNTLDALVRRLNVGKMDRTFHGALLDSEILAEVYLAMTGGQVALAIDVDTQSEGEGSHADFSHLAAQILTANAPLTDHVNWVASLLDKYPQLAETQEVGCFHQVKDTAKISNLVYHRSLASLFNNGSNTSIDPNMANNLFIAC